MEPFRKSISSGARTASLGRLMAVTTPANPSAAEQFFAPRLEEIINEKQSHNP